MKHTEWLAVEHYRIHVIETWPDGPRKEAALAAARSSLESLVQGLPEGFSLPCSTCAGRKKTVIVMPRVSRFQQMPAGLAA